MYQESIALNVMDLVNNSVVSIYYTLHISHSLTEDRAMSMRAMPSIRIRKVRW